MRFFRQQWRLLLMCLVSLFLIVWNQRWVFSYSFDREYLRHFFEHSQWSIPESPRTLSDSELYQVAGDEIMRTHDLFRVSPETPPLGKLLYGLAIQQTGNPYWAVIGAFIAVLGCSVWFFWRWLRDGKKTLLATLLVLTSPLLFTQLQYTNMDIWIVLFLLLSLIGWTYVKEKREVLGGLLIAFGVGGMASVKIGLFAIAVGGTLMLSALWNRRWRTIAIVLLGVSVIYIVTYWYYFQTGHSLLEWMHAQLWILHWYGDTKVPRNFLSLPASLMVGIFKTWWGAGWQRFNEWSVLWLVGLPLWWRWLRREGDGGLRLVSLGLIGLLFMVPLWPRYLLVLLPFWAGVLALSWSSWRRAVQWAMVISLSLSFVANLLPSPASFSQQFLSLWNAGSYSDVYQLLTPELQMSESRPDFHRRWYTMDSAVPFLHHTASVHFSKTPAFWQAKQSGTMTLTYTGGPITKSWDVPIELVRSQGRWRWSWDEEALPLQISDSPEWNPAYPQVGTLTTRDNVVLSHNGTVIHVVMKPALIGANRDLPKLVAQLTNQSQTDVLKKVFVLPYGAERVDVGQLQPGVTADERANLENAAVELLPVPGRAYTDVATPSGMLRRVLLEESQHPELVGRMGGVWGVRHADGTHTVWWTGNPKDGEHSILPLTVQELCGNCQFDSL